MDMWERQKHQPRLKKQSFSSSLLDAIYHSIDDSVGLKEHQEVEDYLFHGRTKPSQVEQEIETVRRTTMIEKWMENYNSSITPRHFGSNSGSSTDSSMFSSSETESSASMSIRKHNRNPILEKPRKISQLETDRRTGFIRTKSKIFIELKKVKEPTSPGAKIANFFNSIFSPRNPRKNHSQEEWNSVRNSKSVKDKTTCSLASRSCLSRTMSLRAKKWAQFSSVQEDCCLGTTSKSTPNVGSNFMKKNLDSFQHFEGKNLRKLHEFRELDENGSDLDDRSCASSDLFELENIGRVGIGSYEEELPVYGTTNLKLNNAVASVLVT